MSLLLRDEVRIGFAPEAVSLVRTSGRGHQKILEKKILQVPQESINGWQAPLALLEKATHENIWKNANARIVLSNHYVRYQLVPASEEALDEDEQKALIHHLFAQTYGASALQWEYRLSGNSKGSGIASAIDRDLLSSVQQVCKNARLRLLSLQPYLASSFNLMRKQIGNRAGWLCVVEPSRFCAVYVRKGCLKNVVNRRLDSTDSVPEIVARLERESIVAGLGDESRAVMVYAPELPKLATRTIGKWKVTKFSIPHHAKHVQTTEPGYALIAGG